MPNIYICTYKYQNKYHFVVQVNCNENNCRYDNLLNNKNIKTDKCKVKALGTYEDYESGCIYSTIVKKYTFMVIQDDGDVFI